MNINANSAMVNLMPAFEQFDGACDPDFDNNLQELEREFAELRIHLRSE
jgi:hypothetical protein